MTTTMTKLLDLISLESFLMATVCIFLIIHIFNLRNFYTGTPPGPWGFPIFGYLFFINNQPFKQFVSLSKKYGDVFSLNIGSRYVVVINHYDVIKEAFIKHGDIFAGKPTEGLAAEFGDYKSVFVTEGNLWKDQRRFLVNSMKDFGFGRTSMEGYIQEEAKLTIEKFMSNINKFVDLTELLHLAVANVISFLIFGQRFSKNDEAVLDTFNHINDVISSSSQVSILEAFPMLQQIFKVLPSFNIFMNGKKKLYSFSDNKIETHRKTFDINNIRDLIDTYIMKQNEFISNGQKGQNIEGNIYDVNYMRPNVASLFLAGVDTTGGTLTWALKLLALNPEAQLKMQEEIDDVVGQERPPSMKDRIKMPFTESVILEVQRFISFLPLTFYHRTTSETYLKGYRIPKHSSVLANLWSVHYDPQIWKNPFQFKPDRFLNEDGKISHLRDYVIPFLLGKRNCLGESLAKMELFLFLVCFLQKLTFHATEHDTKLECIEMPFHKLKSCKLIVIPR